MRRKLWPTYGRYCAPAVQVAERDLGKFLDRIETINKPKAPAISQNLSEFRAIGCRKVCAGVRLARHLGFRPWRNSATPEVVERARQSRIFVRHGSLAFAIVARLAR